jgi:RNA polymerase sigma-70 factor (ECF subfamily)
LTQDGDFRAMELASKSDSDLVRLAKSGRNEAFGELVLRYQDKIYRLARRMTDTQEDAEDVLQEAFVKALKSILHFRGDSRFSTWLYRITVNMALMKRRAKRSNVEYLDDPIPTKTGEIKRELVDTGFDPLRALLAKESKEILDKAIQGLSPTDRAVFVLRDVEGMSTEEAGRILNLSGPATKSRLHRSRLALKNNLMQLVGATAPASIA